MANYYDSCDLPKFNNIGRINEEAANNFFKYYGESMKAGALSEREKALIALAIAHALRCPYCIDAYSSACLEKGADEQQMSEAIHVAASMSAGITLAQSIQMMNKVDELTI